MTVSAKLTRILEIRSVAYNNNDNNYNKNLADTRMADRFRPFRPSRSLGGHNCYTKWSAFIMIFQTASKSPSKVEWSRRYNIAVIFPLKCIGPKLWTIITQEDDWGEISIHSCYGQELHPYQKMNEITPAFWPGSTHLQKLWRWGHLKAP